MTKVEMVQIFDPDEPTTIHTFCSDKCKNQWLKEKKKKQL